MNWVCDSCGYENEYNDESQPTRCLCCGESASENQLNRARRELEKYHREQERQRKLEQLRQKALKRQKKIEDLIKIFVRSTRVAASVCTVLMLVSIVAAGVGVYKTKNSPKHIVHNVKEIMAVDDVAVSVKAVSKHLSENGLEIKDNIFQNIDYKMKHRDNSTLANLGTLTDNRKNIAKSVSGVAHNISTGFGNFTGSLQRICNQVINNVKQLVDYVFKKGGKN